MTPRFAIAAALAGGLILSPATGRAQDATALTALCRDSGAVPGDGGRFCRSLEQLVLVTGSVCRQVPTTPPEICALAYGATISSSEVDAYHETWEHRALSLQRRLDASLPLRDAFFPSTHNSYNSSAYLPTLSQLDMNQHLSLFDQLRMDVRGIELDVHWFPSASGGPNAPLLCHATGPHAGCTVERHAREGLAEVKAFLDLPESASEVLVVDMELHLDDDPAAYAALLAAIADAGLEDEVYGPRDHDGTCGEGIPLSKSRDDVRAAGRRVIVYGGCRDDVPGWNDLVHSSGGRSQSGMPASFAPYPDCGRAGADRHLWTRHWEDTTWLSTMAGAATAPIDAPTLAKLTECTLNMPSLDKLVPRDDRMAAFVWSWAGSEPVDDGIASCAYVDADGRFHSGPCDELRPRACIDDAGDWHFTLDDAFDAGLDDCPSGSAFAVPRNGHQMQRLLEAMDQGGARTPTWVRYRETPDGTWTTPP